VETRWAHTIPNSLGRPVTGTVLIIVFLCFSTLYYISCKSVNRRRHSICFSHAPIKPIKCELLKYHPKANRSPVISIIQSYQRRLFLTLRRGIICFDPKFILKVEAETQLVVQTALGFNECTFAVGSGEIVITEAACEVWLWTTDPGAAVVVDEPVDRGKLDCLLAKPWPFLLIFHTQPYI
jgi:hypothetical protein